MGNTHNHVISEPRSRVRVTLDVDGLTRNLGNQSSLKRAKFNKSRAESGSWILSIPVMMALR